ncbi:MAG TPA: ATP-binding protein, partial [Methylomirabilota bacterium]|nr:ATP-binding protein [Methylomirabilota bacterium]
AIYGPLFTLVMVALVGHAIIRHRLMDIRVVVKRGAVYVSAVLMSAAIFALLLVGSNVLLPVEHDFSVREVVLALVVAVGFYPVKTHIQRLFDRYLYRDPYDFRAIIRETSRALSGTIHLPELLAHVGNALDRALRPERTAIYLFDAEENHYAATWTSGGEGWPAALPTSSPLLALPAPERRLIFRDELSPRPASTEGAMVLAELDRLGSEVAVPLVETREVIGLLVLGPKRSGDPYFSDDADLLATLADQSAVAVRNAQAHARVVQINEELQKILGTIESGVVAVSAKGRVRLFNRAAERLTGVRAEATWGQPTEHLPAPLARLLAATLEDGEARSQVEFSLPDQAGQLVPLVCSTSPLLDAHGAPLGAVAVLGDLSRLKELEQERRRAERLAAIEAMASGLVHEVRNPLVALKTFSQMLPARGEDPAFRENLARVASREIGRVDELLTRFRTLTAPSSQPMEPVDLTGPLAATLELVRPQLEERRIRLRQVADGAPRPILGNASQLEQLFLNLCLNAIDAMEPGGELTVRVADLSQAGGTTLLVEVSDTGSGIPEELLPRIFNPFVTTKAHGTGLGLAICRGIADAHRARLTARNNAGRPGCTFTLEFPVPAAHAAKLAT